jgi:hypothetical protein
MRLFGVAMVRNEADVIEAFVRHNLIVLDGLAIVDHASFDGTSDILRELQREGLPLRVVPDSNAAHFQSQRITQIVREVIGDEGADFVFALDADEFLKSASRATLEQALGEVPVGLHAVAHWLTYVPDSFEDEGAPFGPGHLRRRIRTERNKLTKVIVGRTLLARPTDYVADGNHFVVDPSRASLPSHARVRQDVVAVAHCPVRSRCQLESKIVIGYLAHLARRDGSDAFAYHWRDLYEELRAGATLTPKRLHEIACNYGLPREKWLPVDAIELVTDPVPLRVAIRYRAPKAMDTLRRLMRFTEMVVRRAE